MEPPRTGNDNPTFSRTGRGADTLRTPVPQTVFLCLALGLAVLAVYLQTSRHEFIAFDDDRYVYDNPMVIAGPTPSGLAWAFTTFYYANWHPLTWISHMADCRIFGLNPGAHHLVSLGMHLAATLLLFIALARMTRRPWRSAIVAAVFGLHPLHVESVAWISERKDVLSALFGMLTLLLYIRYAERSSKGRYFSMALMFAFGLMSKPMLVTFPAVLLLLDFWPLRRVEWPPHWPSFRPILLEKAPLFGLAAVSAVLTFIAQRSYGAVASMANLPLPARLGNAAVAYVSYIGKAFRPAGLAVLYPSHPHDTLRVLAACAILTCVTFAALLAARRHPFLFVGWFWYAVMLLPVIGLVQVGVQSMADRYSYLPLIGLSLALVWGVADLVKGSRLALGGIAAATVASLLLLAAAAHRQAGYWKNSRSLFERTLAVTTGNYIIHNNLGVILADSGAHDAAVGHYRQALAIDALYPEAHANLGHELLLSGRLEESLLHLGEALRLKPGLHLVHADVGVALAMQGRFVDSRQHLEASLRIFPGNAEGHSNLCYVLQRLGLFGEAIAHCSEALRLNPGHPNARFNLATALTAQGKKGEALLELRRVLSENPAHAGARDALRQLEREGKE